jgi:hypothetical protein
MRNRKDARRVPVLESLEGKCLLSASAGGVSGMARASAAKPYLLDGTLQDLGGFSHVVTIPGFPTGSAHFTTADDLFGKLKSPGQVGGPQGLKFAEPLVILPAGATPPSFPEPVQIVYAGGRVDLSGSTVTLEQVKKAGKQLTPIPSSGTMVLSIASSTTNTYRFTITSATGKFAQALDGTGTVTYTIPKKALPTLQFRSDRT